MSIKRKTCLILIKISEKLIMTNIDVQTFLNQNKFSPFQWLVFILCFLVVLLDGFDTAAIGYIAPSLMKEWGIARPDLAPVLSAALFGLAGGAFIAGPLADFFGRRLVLIMSVLVFGAACLASSYASSLDALTIMRFITGLGLGAAMPNAITLVSEYCPDKKRSMITNAMFCAFPLGAACGGFLAAEMIPVWGWRSVLQLGGIAPLALTLVLITALPESIRLMVAKGFSLEKIKTILTRISPTASQAQSFSLAESALAQKNGAVLVLSPKFAFGTFMLWLTYFMGLVIFYALINWMPVLLEAAKIEPKNAKLISALFPLGGVGAILSGWLMDRYNANWIVTITYALTAVLIFAIGQSVGSLGFLMLAVFGAGIVMNTAQCSMPSLAASFYPTQGRATGVAWMLAFGRFGAIASTFLVAELVRRDVGFANIFVFIAIPGAIAAIAITLKQLVHPERKITG
jgi:MFS transporter, AAHS family, 4-hydroxybenzoate transporter